MTSEIDQKRKRAYMRAVHRGMKEMDIMLGRFADAHLQSMDSDDLHNFEQFMMIDDQSLYAIVTGQIEVAPHFEGLVRKIRESNGIQG